jgi:hypothetical protein
MRLFPRKPVSDDEYVVKLRRSVATFDKWRWWLAAPHAIGLAVIIVLGFQGVSVLLQLVGPANGPLALQGFEVGAIMGMSLGWLAHHCVWGIISIVGGLKSERLLLKYYGECIGEQTLSADLDAAPEPDDGGSYQYVEQREGTHCSVSES